MSSHCATVGSDSSWCAGTNTCGIAASAASAALFDEAPAMVREDGRDHLFGLAHDHGIGERRERQRVAEGERTARQDERVTLAPFFAQGGNTGCLEERNGPRDLEFVSNGDGYDGEVGERAQRFVGDRLLVFGSIAIGQEGPLAAHPFGLLDRSVDALVPQRAHPYGVRRRVSQGDSQRSSLGKSADFGAQALIDETGGDSG